MNTPAQHREALAEVAADWREPTHPPRAAAVEKTLEAPNRWTEVALNYALNRWMQQVTLEALGTWLPEAEPASKQTVGVLHGDRDPVEGIRAALAVWGSGHSYVGCVPEASPALLPAFVEELSDRSFELSAQFESAESLYTQADALIAYPDEGETETVHERCEYRGLARARRLVFSPQYSVGVLDGTESEDERDRLAEDLLLYEGEGARRLALLWAPRDLSPDPYLEAMARFRGMFPAHPDTPGALQMQKAFLEARDASHAFAEGLEFLVSRGEPEPQPHGHIRWTEYDDLDEVTTWVEEQLDPLYAVVARSGLHDRMPERWPLRTPGGLHIPPLADREGEAIVALLRSIGGEK